MELLENFQDLAEGERDQRLLAAERKQAALKANLVNLSDASLPPELPHEPNPLLVDVGDLASSLQLIARVARDPHSKDASDRAGEMLPIPLPLQPEKPDIHRQATANERRDGLWSTVLAELKDRVSAKDTTTREDATHAKKIFRALQTAQERKKYRKSLIWPIPFLMDFPNTTPTVQDVATHPDLQLDDRQTLAFQIFATSFFHELKKDEEAHTIPAKDRRYLQITAPHQQLVMHVPGKAGVGKSRVIKAIQALIASYSKDHWLLVGCFTGTAANKVGGRTLHSLFKIGKKFSPAVRAMNRSILLRPSS